MNEMMAIASGCFVGFVLGLIGGGGSIVATPLLLYAVGLPPHVAIGTGALAVSANAFVNFGGHARAGNVRWAEAALFAATGVVGALIGSTIGKEIDGKRLILLFAMMMLVVGVAMLRPRKGGGSAACPLTARTATRIAVIGLVVGAMSGFFGIGGGIAGGYLGTKAACRLAAQRSTLNRMFATLVFATLVFVVAFYIIWRSVGSA